MTTHRARFLACAAASLLVLVAACGRERREPGPRPDDAAAPQRGGTVVIAVSSEPDVLNSLTRNSTVAGQVLSLMQASLAELGEDLQWQPMIARSWELAPDSLAITYHLRPWRWSDGAPLTSRDVVSSHALLVDPRVGSPRAGQLDAVRGLTAPDDSTVVYALARRVARPLDATVHSLLPDHVTRHLDPADVAAWPLNQRPLASGPFMLQQWDHHRQLVLVPNSYYPLAPPRLDRVVLRVLPDETARMLALEVGDVDVVAGLTADAAARLAGDARFVVHEVPSRTLVFVLWNLARPELRDPRVRRALSLALERDRMVAEILQGRADAAASLLPPVMWNHHADLAPDPHDPAAARDLLAQAGWRDDDGDGVREREGRPLRLELLVRGGTPALDEVAVLIRDDLGAVGVRADLHRLELPVMVDRLRDGDFTACLLDFTINLWADLAPHVQSTATDRLNFGAYANSVVDSLLAAAAAQPDRARSLPTWRRLQEVLAEDPPAALLYYPHFLVGVNARVRGARPHVLSPYNNLHEWWIAPANRRWRAAG